MAAAYKPVRRRKAAARAAVELEETPRQWHNLICQQQRNLSIFSSSKDGESLYPVVNRPIMIDFIVLTRFFP